MTKAQTAARRKRERTFAVEVASTAPRARVTAIAYRSTARAEAFATLVLGHGAGADQRHPFMVGMGRRLAARGVDVVTYNFVYTEMGRKAPDRNDALEACARAVLEAVRGRKTTRPPLFIGGKSMGGRIASQIAVDVVGIAGLVFLGYPLHPPGKLDQLRTAHLPRVPAPMLFVQGSRDPFGTPGELAPIVRALAKKGAKTGSKTQLHVVPEGDHSLVVPKRVGVPQDAIYDGVADAIASWMRGVTSAS